MVSLRYGARTIMTGEATASQLPGRDFGPADAYRHIVLAAEWTRVYGTEEAVAVLTDHELSTAGAADRGMDFWNNEIGIRIGDHIAANGGSWEDVLVLAREAVVKSFAGMPYEQIPERWTIHEADDGLRIGYGYFYESTNAYAVNGYPPPPFQKPTFEAFAADYNRGFRFRTAANGPIQLDGGTLEVNPIATTSPRFWEKNPEVEGQDVSVEESAYPDQSWAAGGGFVYEPGNGSDAY